MSAVELRVIEPDELDPDKDEDDAGLPSVEGLAGGPSEGRMVRLETHASVAGVWYPIGGRVQEKIVPGAFKRSLGMNPTMTLLVNHGIGGALPIAHSKGTPPLEVSEDSCGNLLAKADMPLADPDALALKAKAERMPLEASFSFRCNRDRWSADETRREV